MSGLLSSILLAANHFFTFAGLLTIPFVLVQVVKNKINFVRMGINYVFLFYVMCVIGLVFFPLPSMTGEAVQSVHGLQMIPFHFVSDIVRETSFVWNQPQTYLRAMVDWAVLQVVFNVIMFVPFGMYLRYNFHFDGKKLLYLLSFLVCLLKWDSLPGCILCSKMLIVFVTWMI